MDMSWGMEMLLQAQSGSVLARGWLRWHEVWPLDAITQKKRTRSSTEWMLKEAGICGQAHGLITSQPGNALQGNIQAGNKSHHCLLGHPLHGLLKASKQQEGNYSLFGPCHGTTPLLQVNSALCWRELQRALNRLTRKQAQKRFLLWRCYF